MGELWEKIVSGVIVWVIGTVIIAIMIMLWTWWTGRAPESKEIMLNTLMRQTYRWLVASQQDTNIAIRILHADYAVAYVDAMRGIATDQEILASTGQDIRLLSAKVSAQQDVALKALAGACSKVVPEDQDYRDYLSKLLQDKQ